MFLLCILVAQDSGIDVDTAKSRAEVVDIASRRKFSQHFHNFVDVCLEKDPTDRSVGQRVKKYLNKMVDIVQAFV